MQIRGTNLSYCMNVHPARTFADVLENIDNYAAVIGRRVAGDKPFGIGLWAPNTAIAGLQAAAPELRRTLAERQLYVFTLNGFPYGVFHGARVKEQVYFPDWGTAERLDYTTALIDVLASLLPDGVRGSVSTLPCTYGKELPASAINNLLAAARHARQVHTDSGRHIVIGLEPEPDGFLESAAEGIDFCRQLYERDPQIHDYIGLCFDTCHICVAGENPMESFNACIAADVEIAKVHVSAALRCDNRTGPAARQQLSSFDEPVYLHQTLVWTDGKLTSRYRDLDAALEDNPVGTWLVHFHVPLPFVGTGGLTATSDQLTPAFLQLATDHCPNMEIETYTFDVLPPPKLDIVTSITDEFDWMLERLAQD